MATCDAPPSSQRSSDAHRSRCDCRRVRPIRRRCSRPRHAWRWSWRAKMLRNQMTTLGAPSNGPAGTWYIPRIDARNGGMVSVNIDLNVEATPAELLYPLSETALGKRRGCRPAARPSARQVADVFLRVMRPARHAESRRANRDVWPRAERALDRAAHPQVQRQAVARGSDYFSGVARPRRDIAGVRRRLEVCRLVKDTDRRRLTSIAQESKRRECERPTRTLRHLALIDGWFPLLNAVRSGGRPRYQFINNPPRKLDSGRK
jgi:hypothetical protein